MSHLANLYPGHLVVNLCFSPDGTQLLLTYEGGVAELWDLRLIRERLAEMNLDWESPPLRSVVAGESRGQPFDRPTLSVTVITNAPAAAAR